MKAIVHLQGGMGDYYYLLSMLPHIIAERMPETCTAWIDSIYFHQQGFEREAQATAYVLNRHFKEWNVIPAQSCSFMLHNAKWVANPDWESVRRDFLFHRLERSKTFMQSKLGKEDLFLAAIIGLSYEWKNGENIMLDYPVEPLNLGSIKPKTLPGNFNNAVLFHIRTKGRATQPYEIIRILDGLTASGIETILIGNPHEMDIPPHPLRADLRHLPFTEQLWLVENAHYMITGSSMFTYHRLMFHRPTIVLTPESLGPATRCYHKSVLHDEKHVFLNADVPQTDAIISYAQEWYNARD